MACSHAYLSIYHSHATIRTAPPRRHIRSRFQKSRASMDLIPWRSLSVPCSWQTCFLLLQATKHPVQATVVLLWVSRLMTVSLRTLKARHVEKHRRSQGQSLKRQTYQKVTSCEHRQPGIRSEYSYLGRIHRISQPLCHPSKLPFCQLRRCCEW